MGGASSIMARGLSDDEMSKRRLLVSQKAENEKDYSNKNNNNAASSCSMTPNQNNVVIGTLLDSTTSTNMGDNESLYFRENPNNIIPKSDQVRSLLLSALKGHFIFETLSQNHLDDLVDVFTPVNCNVGEDIIQQGVLGDFMYVIEEGLFEISKKGEGKLSECGPGVAFGELSLLFNAERSATVTCIQKAKLWKLDRRTFKYYRASSLNRSSKYILKILADIPLFNTLNSVELTRIYEVAKPLYFAEGDVIIKQGDSGNTFYIIMEGVVNCSDANFIVNSRNALPSSTDFSVSTYDDNDSSPALSSPSSLTSIVLESIRLKAGEWFGEVALLEKKIVNNNVKLVADSPVRLLAFEREQFEKVLGNLKDLMERQTDNKMLSELPIIAKIPEERRELAVSMFSIEKYEKGDIIANCGDVNPRLIVIKSGEALVWQHPQFLKHQRDSDSSPTLSSSPSLVLGENCRKQLIRINERFSADMRITCPSNFNDEEPDEPPPVIARRGELCQDMARREEGYDAIETAEAKHGSVEPHGLPLVTKQETKKSSSTSIDEPHSPPPLYHQTPLSSKVNQRTLSSGPTSGDTIEEHLSKSLLITPKETGAMRSECCEGRFDVELESFEMRSTASSFDKSEFGRLEVQWRKNLAQSHLLASSRSTSSVDEEDIDEQEDIFSQGTKSATNRTMEQHESTILAGDSVGEDAIYNATPMNCTVIAKGSVTCYVLDRKDLINLLFEDNPNIASREPGMTVDDSVAETNINNENVIIWDNLRNMGEIGSGTFGTVYLMEDIMNQRKYALKVVDVKYLASKHENRIKTEIDILKQMKSPYICKLYSNAIGGGKYFMVLEYVPGNFKKLIHPSGVQRENRTKRFQDIEEGKLAGMPHQAAKFYIATICIPLVYMHRRGIAYRDLKPENIMIDSAGYPKLVDFGLSKRIDPSIGKTFTLCGTTEYLAPEVILGDGHNQAADWWSLGILLYEMVVGVTPFSETGAPQNQEQMETFKRIVNGEIHCPETMEKDCNILIRKLLIPKPVFRLGCCRRGSKEFEEHDWFQGEVDWVALNIRQMRPPWIPSAD